jgi:hypothetical protein
MWQMRQDEVMCHRLARHLLGQWEYAMSNTTRDTPRVFRAIQNGRGDCGGRHIPVCNAGGDV